MQNRSPRAPLSAALKRARIERARCDLQDLKDRTDPFHWECLTNRDLATPEAGRIRSQESFTQLRHQYEAILVHLRPEWNNYCARIMPQYKLIREFDLLGHVPRRGAPRKPPAQREDALLAREVAEQSERLRLGSELRHRYKRAGGASSDD